MKSSTYKPQVRGHMLFGSLRALQRDPLGLFADAAKLGPVVQLRFLHQRMHLVSEPSLIEGVLHRNHTDYSRVIITSGFNVAMEKIMERSSSASLPLFVPTPSNLIIRRSRDRLRATSTALTWTFYLLSKHESVRHQLEAELNREVSRVTHRDPQIWERPTAFVKPLISLQMEYGLPVTRETRLPAQASNDGCPMRRVS